jgi:GNAT superfamily N-acetyltransferase
LNIRLATPQDAHIIHRIQMDAYEEYRHVPGSSSALTENVDFILDSLQSGKKLATIGYVDDQPVACVRFSMDHRGLNFARLSVCTAWRGQGLAKLLLSWLESYALEREHQAIWCTVRASVPRNLHLYKSMGYVEYDEEIEHKPDNVILKIYTMCKLLEPSHA